MSSDQRPQALGHLFDAPVADGGSCVTLVGLRHLAQQTAAAVDLQRDVQFARVRSCSSDPPVTVTSASTDSPE